MGTVALTARQNHLHITFRHLHEEYKEESIHQHCMKNEHPHTKTKQTLSITLEPLVSVVEDNKQVIRSHQWKDKQYNCQRKKDKNDEYKKWTTKYYTEN